MKHSPGFAGGFGPRTRPATNLRGTRWTLASNSRETWLVIGTADGPRGVRLLRKDREVVAYEVGAFVVFLAADGSTVFTILEEKLECHDASLFEDWRAAGRPRLRATSDRAAASPALPAVQAGGLRGSTTGDESR